MTNIPGACADPNDPGPLSRIEDAGLNATAPRQQRWVDGWMVRLCPGNAKRARSIQPVAPGQFGVDQKLALCLPLYAAAGLRPYVRVTPFAEPAGLDGHLAALGMELVDESRVMVLATLAAFRDCRAELTDLRIEGAAPDSFAEWIGAARGATADERRSHADRIAHATVPHHAVLARDPQGLPVAGGQIAVEGRVVGLYDLFTLEHARQSGHAAEVCRHLFARASQLGADVGYLQVGAGNEAARRIYRRLGFADAYSYHYRTPRDWPA